MSRLTKRHNKKKGHTQPMEPTNQEPTQEDQHNEQLAPLSTTPTTSNPSSRSLTQNKPLLIGLLGLGLLAVILLAVTLNKPASDPKPRDNTNTAVTEARQAAITITQDGFTPATITIKKGTKLTWTNTDTAEHAIASDPHPTHTGLKGLESTSLPKDGTYSFTFDKPGTYTYHDHLNPYTLKGTVVVE